MIIIHRQSMLFFLQSDLAFATYQFEQILSEHAIHGVIGPQDSEVVLRSLGNFVTRYNTTQVNLQFNTLYNI